MPESMSGKHYGCYTWLGRTGQPSASHPIELEGQTATLVAAGKFPIDPNGGVIIHRVKVQDGSALRTRLD
jgi:hypothetical protein